jgi:hypothetical protein
MNKYTFKRIPKNSQLLAIGNFYRKDSADEFWRFGSYFAKEDYSIESIPFNIESSCVMGAGREFIQEVNQPYIVKGFEKDIRLPNVSYWQNLLVGEFPHLRKKLAESPEVNRQQCFVFEAGGIRFWLPKFELARKLFFHTGFLARAAFLPNGLDMLFESQEDPEESRTSIRAFHPGVPARYIKHQDYRRFFTWLVLNDEAKKSFNSIWRNLNTEQALVNKYWRWVFSFTPPQFLSGMKASVRGQFVAEASEFFIREVAALHDLPLAHDGAVNFFHSKVKRPIKGTGEGGNGSSDPYGGGSEVDDQEEADDDKSMDLIELPSESLSYSKYIETKIEYSGKRKGKAGKEDEEEDGNSGNGSTQDPVEGGTAKPTDVDQLDEEESLQEYQNRFLLLLEVLKELGKSGDQKYCGKQVRPLPVVKRCKFHMLNETTKRCYLLAQFRLPNGAYRYILEIDTSDRKRSLSTKIIQFKPGVDRDEVVEEILKRTVKYSLRWPQEYIQLHASYVKEVVHPKFKSGSCSDHSISSWKNRIQTLLKN